MDYFKRSAQGRNAEVLGYKLIKNDFFLRVMELENRAKKIFQDLPDEEKNVFISYANGVNEIIQNKNWRKPSEFEQLGYHPESWNPWDSISIILLQSLNQTLKTFRLDMDQDKWIQKYGLEAKNLFNEENSPWFTPILKKGEYQASKESKTTYKNQKLPFDFSQIYELSSETGSNNWVVDKKLSENNVAMLANDPHLDLKRPAYWYYVHLESPEINAIGGTLPGLPYILSGTTEKISFGLTNAYYNTADGFLIGKEELKKLEKKTIRPHIKFKWWKITLPFIFKSTEIVDGKYPLIPMDVAQKDKVLAFRWSGFDIEAKDILSFRSILKAKNIDEAYSSLKKMRVPAWNFVFADTKGEIGYHVVGKLPLETNDQFGLRELSKDQFPFQYLNPENHPHLVRPKRGFVVTANQKHYGPDSLYKGGNGYALSMRGFQIEKMIQQKLAQKKKMNVDDFKQIQCDVQNPEFSFFKEFFDKALNEIAHPAKEAFSKLWNQWDGNASLDCQVCPVFRHVIEKVKEKNELNDVSLYSLLVAKKEIGFNSQLEQSLTQFYDKDKKEFQKWGDYHQLPFDHISGINHLGETQTPLPTIGDQNTINPGTAKFEDDRWKHYSGASKRLIVEMGQKPKVWLTLPATNRTNFYLFQKDKWDNWARCEYKLLEFPVDWSKIILKKI
jgi:penicillin amidase